jgi:hypothetical protein
VRYDQTIQKVLVWPDQITELVAHVAGSLVFSSGRMIQADFRWCTAGRQMGAPLQESSIIGGICTRYCIVHALQACNSNAVHDV